MPFCATFRAQCLKVNPAANLLQIKNVIIEVILQLLVCIVDAELLEAVDLEVFKAKNVQDTDGQALENNVKVSLNHCSADFLLSQKACVACFHVLVSYRNRLLHIFLVEQCMVDAKDYPVKQGTVKRFGHGVSSCDGLMGEWRDLSYIYNFTKNFQSVIAKENVKKTYL